MANPPVYFSEPINSLGYTDALSRILNSIGISGSLLLKEEYYSPWAVTVPHSVQMNAVLNIAKDIHIATFHLVERGQIHISYDSGDKLTATAGEMVISFSGQGHRLYQGELQAAIPFQEIMTGTENRFQSDKAGEQDSTSLVCGIFSVQDTLLNPLLAALPERMKINVSNAVHSPRLNGIVNLMLQEFDSRSIGNHYVMDRYLEILCAEIIRAHMDSLPKQASGWLSALRDPVIGRVIEAIHVNPGHAWSVKKLAAEVAISPSRLAARFVATVGESPMNYVTKWRLIIACRQLQEPHNSIAAIANSVGYESMASFSRAFKRHTGLPPATWRKRFLKRQKT